MHDRGTQDRGQALTLEGLLAAVLIVMSLLFALQVSAVTPLTESTSSQHIENQQQEVGQNVLGAAAEDGTLKATLLYWEPDHESEGDGGFIGAPETSGGAYTSGIPTDTDSEEVEELGTLLDRSFSERGIVYNMYVNYATEEGLDSEQVVNQGQPSAHAVTATKTITLYTDDEIAGTGSELGGAGDDEFYADEMDSDTIVYNVVEVELVIWRM